MNAKVHDIFGVGHKLAFFTRPTLRHVDGHASSRYRPVGRDRRSLLLDRYAAGIILGEQSDGRLT
jgi:hypothetical protein